MSQYIRYPSLSGSFVPTALPSGQILVGNGSNIATPVTASGDLSNTNAGVFTILSVGGSTAAAINSATILSNNATALNTPSQIVLRDGSGNFAAGTITATLNGNATNITGIAAVANGGTGLSSGTSGGVLAYTGTGTLASSGLLTNHALILGGGAGVVPSTPLGLGTTTTVLHGNAAGAPTWSAVSLSADVTGNLPVANLNSGTAASSTTFWRGDATWAAPTGTVSSVGFSVPATSIFAATGSPVTGSGTLGFTTTGVSGGIPYFDTTSTLHTSSILTANQILVGGGAGSSPAPIGSLGTTTTVLHGNAAGAPTFGAVVLTTDVSGTLPIANGGTNSTATATAGGVGYGTATAHAYTGAGTSGQFLKSAGTSAPAFASFTPPTTQIFLSGTGTYTTPAGAVYLRVIIVGGGGGGGGSGTGNTGGSGGTGGNTTFGTSLLTANGGVGAANGNSGLGGVGGTTTITAPALEVVGQNGGPGNDTSGFAIVGATYSGGTGAASPFGGAGSGGTGSAVGSNAIGHSGSGGGGAGGAGGITTSGPAGGGGAGGYIEAIIPSPSATYAYAVGGTGAGGSAGTSGFAGGTSGSGRISVIEYYQ